MRVVRTPDSPVTEFDKVSDSPEQMLPSVAHDGVPDVDPDDVYKRYNWPVPPWTLALQRYEHGTLGLYLPIIGHFGNALGESEPGDDVIVVYHPGIELATDPGPGLRVNQVNVRLLRSGGSEVEFPVLVTVDKLVEDRKGMHVEPLPFVVRLDRLDQRLSGGADTGADRDGTAWARVENWKLGPGRLNTWLSSIKLDQFPGEVIEARSQVVNGVAENGSSAEWRWFGDLPGNGNLARARFLISNQSVRLAFEIPSELGVEFGQVFLGPVKLGQNAV